MRVISVDVVFMNSVEKELSNGFPMAFQTFESALIITICES